MKYLFKFLFNFKYWFHYLFLKISVKWWKTTIKHDFHRSVCVFVWILIPGAKIFIFSKWRPNKIYFRCKIQKIRKKYHTVIWGATKQLFLISWNLLHKIILINFTYKPCFNLLAQKPRDHIFDVHYLYI